MKKKRVLKLNKETLRRLDEHVLHAANGGATLGCETASICSDCNTYVSCHTNCHSDCGTCFNC